MLPPGLVLRMVGLELLIFCRCVLEGGVEMVLERVFGVERMVLFDRVLVRMFEFDR